MLNFLFANGPALPTPGLICGPDPTKPEEPGCRQSFCDPDSDNDGFTDRMETGQVLVDGINLAGLQANPQRPDIFVEIDWMDLPGDHSHAPDPDGLQLVVDAFNNSPVQTIVNGQVVSTGITLHLDTGTDPFNMGGGGPTLAHQDFLSQQNTLLDSFALFQAIETIKSDPQNFDPARRNIFHYSIWAHRLSPGDNRGGASQELFTDDFIVSLGHPQWAQIPDQKVLQACIFMHGLGHCLGLEHGGFQSFPWGKPNYRSVMNLRYGVQGVDTDCDADTDDKKVDFSAEVLADIDERMLDENEGICGNVPIDWNGNMIIEQLTTFVDITCDFFGNCDNFPNILTGWDDWRGGRIRLDFQNSRNINVGALGGGGASADHAKLNCPAVPDP